MPDTEIKQALSDMDDGHRVRVRMDDGTELDAIVDGEELRLEDSEDPLDPERIDRVLLDASSPGPE